MKRLLRFALSLLIAAPAHAQSDDEIMRPWEARAHTCRLALQYKAAPGQPDFLDLLFKADPHHPTAEQMQVRRDCMMFNVGFLHGMAEQMADELKSKGN